MPVQDPCEGVTLRKCYWRWYDPELPCDSTANIVAAQIVMKQNGLYQGPLDGIWGKGSQAAFDASIRSGLASPFAECQGPEPVYIPPKPQQPPSHGVDEVSVAEASTSAIPVLGAAAMGVLIGMAATMWRNK